MQQWFSNTEGHSQTSAFATMPFEEISSPVGVVSGSPYELSHPLVPGCPASLPHSENTWPSVSLVITKRANPLLFCCHSMFCQ